ncbi:putative Retinoblastoma-associated protein [Nannochloris sp. 'desiccata']|nr:putative Retinoblastoma-associated protein [Chlorella desiccata (nom. nud.)]
MTAYPNPELPNLLRLNPTGEPSTPPPATLRLHQVLKSFQGARTNKGAADTLQCLVAASLSCRTLEQQHDLAPQVYLAATKLTQAVDALLAEILAPIGLHPVGVEELYSSSQSSFPLDVPPGTSVPFSGGRLFVGLIDADGQVPESAMHALNTYIDQVVCPNVEIDERVFLEEEEEKEAQEGATVALPVPENVSLTHIDQATQQQNVQSLGFLFQGHIMHTPPRPSKAKTREEVQPIPHVSQAAVGAVGSRKSRGLSTIEAFEALQWLDNIAMTIDINTIQEHLVSYGVSEETRTHLATSATSMLHTAAWPAPEPQPMELEEERPGGGAGAFIGLTLDSSRLRELAMSLFYCTLNSLLQAELGSATCSAAGTSSTTPSTTSNTASSALINKIASNTVLTQCIMVLSLECVLSSAQLGATYDFPASLKICHNASAFAVARLLPRFYVTHQKTMSEVLKRHLLFVEERIIEKYAWEEGSSLFEMLREATTSGITAEELPPRKLGRAVATTTDTPKAITSQAHTLLSAFIDKAMKLVTVRLSHLLFSSTGLRGQSMAAAATAASDHLLLQIVTAVDAILREHTWLMYGRHLDQIMVCAMYGITKGATQQVVAFSGGFRGLLDAYNRCFGSDYIYNVSTLWVDQYLNSNASGSGGAGVLPLPAFPQQQQPPERNQSQRYPPTIHIFQFYNTIFLPETHAILKAIVAGEFPLLPQLPTVPLKPAVVPAATAARTATSVPPPGTSPWSQQNTRTLPFIHRIKTSSATEFSFPSPSRTMKLSPGRWNVSTAGTQLVSSMATLPEEQVQHAHRDYPEHGVLQTGRKRRKKERRRSGPTIIGTPPARGTYRPVDALLAAAAGAEEELRKSTPSSSGGESGSGSDT